MTDSVFWAHSARDTTADSTSQAGWQLLNEHLENVSKLTGELARHARPNDERLVQLAMLCGLLHDYGKYANAFQRMIRGRLKPGERHPQHAIHGADLAYWGYESKHESKPFQASAAWAIAGHHGGLPDMASLQKRLTEQVWRDETLSLLSTACRDLPALRCALEQQLPHLKLTRDSPELAELDLFTRMLFSCLVDADRLDSSGARPVQAPLLAGERLDTLLAHLAQLSGKSPEGPVKAMRARALQDCLDAAALPGSLFSLPVPTGGGKTLAAMAFALRRATLYSGSFRRIIVVIPYLSIIEQNARVYSELFGSEAILEHHSGSHVALLPAQDERYVADPGKDDEDCDGQEFQETGHRTDTENWDAPIIITTSVRFFESLFSNRPRDLRRIHNIARSIVILDEVQTLPRHLLGPLLGMMRELAANWGVNFLFSTATQPAFERPAGTSFHKDDLLWPAGTMTEIIRDPAEIRRQLNRARISWEIDEAVSWEFVARRLLDASQCLAIVNLRDHASELYRLLKMQAAQRGFDMTACFHLSTRMCAAHRLRVLDQIRTRLKDGHPCWVVSTQLIEAGVDVDFPRVLRALAPLEAIIQAAGRADREGKLTALHGTPGGEVIVFLPEDHRTPPDDYRYATDITGRRARTACADQEPIQVDSPAIRDYFREYIDVDAQLLGRELVLLRKPLDPGQLFDIRFATLAQKFEMISSRTRDVYVEDDAEATAVLEELRKQRYLSRDLRRRLQRHTVGLNPGEFEKARHLIERFEADQEIWIASKHAYSKEFGLQFDLPIEQSVLCDPHSS